MRRVLARALPSRRRSEAFPRRSGRSGGEKPGHIPLSEIKLLKADPAQVLAQSEMIKTRYSKLFGV